MPDWSPYVYPVGSVEPWNELVLAGKVHPSLFNLQDYMEDYRVLYDKATMPLVDYSDSGNVVRGKCILVVNSIALVELAGGIKQWIPVESLKVIEGA